MVEQAAVNRKVEGSSPSLGAIFFREAQEGENPRGQKSSGFLSKLFAPEWRNWQTHRT